MPVIPNGADKPKPLIVGVNRDPRFQIPQEPVFFFEKRVGNKTEIINVLEKEAWQLWNNPPQYFWNKGRNAPVFTYIGQSNGDAMVKGLREAQEMLNSKGLEASQERIRSSILEELEEARKNPRPPRDMNKFGTPDAVNLIR